MNQAKIVENSQYIGRATVIIAVFSVLAKILGLIRDAVFSHQFGTSAVIDAYFAAFRIPDFVFNLLILGTFSVAFIPVFSEYLLKDKIRAEKLASSILNVTLIMMIALCLVAFLLIGPLMKVIAPGFDSSREHLTRVFTQIFLLSPIFLSLSAILSSILNTYKKFMIVAAAPVFYNLSIIFGVLVLYPKIGDIGLAIGVVLGAFLHFAVQIPQLLSMRFKYSFAVDFKEPGFIKFWRLYWPRIFSMGTGQITLMIATFFGSYLAAGSLSAFYYANNLQAVFLSVFAVSAALAVFPLLSDLFNLKDQQGFKDVVARTTIQILFFMIPLSALMLILRAQIVRLILGIGQNTNFSFADTKLVSLTLGLFSISLFAQALIPLFNRAFYAMHDTAVPVVIGIITIIVNVLATFYLIKSFGIPGMALAFSVTSVINLVLLLAELHYKIGAIHDQYLIINTLKILIASAIAAASSYGALYLIASFVDTHTYWGIFSQTALSGLAGCAIFVGFGWVLGLSEAQNLLKTSKNVLIKSTRPITILVNYFS